MASLYDRACFSTNFSNQVLWLNINTELFTCILVVTSERDLGNMKKKRFWMNLKSCSGFISFINLLFSAYSGQGFLFLSKLFCRGSFIKRSDRSEKGRKRKWGKSSHRFPGCSLFHEFYWPIPERKLNLFVGGTPSFSLLTWWDIQGCCVLCTSQLCFPFRSSQVVF